MRHTLQHSTAQHNRLHTCHTRCSGFLLGSRLLPHTPQASGAELRWPLLPPESLCLQRAWAPKVLSAGCWTPMPRSVKIILRGSFGHAWKQMKQTGGRHLASHISAHSSGALMACRACFIASCGVCMPLTTSIWLFPSDLPCTLLAQVQFGGSNNLATRLLVAPSSTCHLAQTFSAVPRRCRC